MNVAFLRRSPTFTTFTSNSRSPRRHEKRTIGNSLAPACKRLPLQVHQVHFACGFMSLGHELVLFTSSCKFIKFIFQRLARFQLMRSRQFFMSKISSHCRLSGWTCDVGQKIACTALILYFFNSCQAKQGAVVDVFWNH